MLPLGNTAPPTDFHLNCMVRLLFLTILATALTGCGGKSYKVDHPVVGPVPPRIPASGRAVAMADDEQQARGQSGEVQLVSTSSDATKPFEMTDVVATVNGKPILVASVLGPMRSKVEAIRKQVPPAQFRQIQEQAIRDQLPSHIEQAMMVAVMQVKLKAEQAKAVSTQIDSMFEQELDRMRANMEKQQGRQCTLADLEADIQRQGMTLAVMRKMFGDKIMAQQYMVGKLENAEPISRPELLAAYQERIKEFSEPPAIKSRSRTATSATRPKPGSTRKPLSQNSAREPPSAKSRRSIPTVLTPRTAASGTGPSTKVSSPNCRSRSPNSRPTSPRQSSPRRTACRSCRSWNAAK